MVADMHPDVIPIMYQVFYIAFPTISIIGNAFIIYVTIRSQSLRSTCNIFIALISVGDLLHSFSHYVMLISYNISENHEIREDICVYLQLLPLFGCFFSSLMVFNVALDRLLSLQRIYTLIDGQYKKHYMAAEIMLAFLYSLAMVSWTFSKRTSEETVVCIVTAPVTGLAYNVFINVTLFFNILIIICYILFICSLKKVNMSNDRMKHIYRSLIVISMTVVFGWLSTILIGFVTSNILHADIERIYIDLLAGLFVNLSCAASFFVYYALSNEYRRVFDQNLPIGYAKNWLGFKSSVVTIKPTTNGRLQVQPQRTQPSQRYF